MSSHSPPSGLRRLALSALLLAQWDGLRVRFRSRRLRDCILYVHVETGDAWLAGERRKWEEVPAGYAATDQPVTAAQVRDTFQLRARPWPSERDGCDRQPERFCVLLRTGDAVTTLGMDADLAALAPFRVKARKTSMAEWGREAAITLQLVHGAENCDVSVLIGCANSSVGIGRAALPDTGSDGPIAAVERLEKRAAAGEHHGAEDAMASGMELFELEVDVDRLLSLQRRRRCHAERMNSVPQPDTDAPQPPRWLSIERDEELLQWAVGGLCFPTPMPMRLVSGALDGKEMSGDWTMCSVANRMQLWCDGRPVRLHCRPGEAGRRADKYTVDCGEPDTQATTFAAHYDRRSQQWHLATTEHTPAMLYLGVERGNRRLTLKSKARSWERFRFRLDEAAVAAAVKQAWEAPPRAERHATDAAYFAAAMPMVDHRDPAEAVGIPRGGAQRLSKTAMARRRQAVADKVAKALAEREDQERSTRRPSTSASGRTNNTARSPPTTRAPASESDADEEPDAASTSGHATDAASNATASMMAGGGAGSTCHACRAPIQGAYVRALNRAYHPGCFACSFCNKPLSASTRFRQNHGRPFCDACYASQIAPRCARCQQPVTDLVVTAMDRHWHRECLTCFRCKRPLCDSTTGAQSSQFYLYDRHPDRPFCERCVIGMRRDEQTRTRQQPPLLSSNRATHYLRPPD